MPSNRKWWPPSAPVVGAVLLLIGTVGLLRCPNQLGVRFSEALLISSVLTLTVDLYLKRKLQEDAAKDIFGHLLGINLPPELREKLQAFLFENKTYRTNSLIEVHVEVAGDAVQLNIDGRTEVVAVSDAQYEPMLSFEESVDAHVLETSITSTNRPDISYTLKNVALVPSSVEAMVMEWRGKQVSMQKGEHLTASASYTVRRSTRDFLVLHFGAAHINPRLLLTADENLEVAATAPDQRNGDEYLYKRVFLKGDHLYIRWKKRTGAELKARAASA